MPPPLHWQVETFWTEELLGLMSEAGVDAAILAPPAFFPEGNVMMPQEVARYPDRLAAWGYFPVRDPASRELIATWRKPPYMLGARFIFMTPETQLMWTDGSMDWLWGAAEQFHLPLGVYAYGHLDVIARAAEAHPALRLMVDHMALDLFSRGQAALVDLPALLGLARFPNVGVKLSGLPAQSAEAYPYRDLHLPIRRVVDAFGPERCFWGSDLTRQPCDYRQSVTLFTEELPWLAGAALELVMGRAICKWAGWQPAGLHA